MLFSFQIRNMETHQCVDTMMHDAGHKAGLFGCHGQGGNQVSIYGCHGDGSRESTKALLLIDTKVL